MFRLPVPSRNELTAALSDPRFVAAGGYPPLAWDTYRAGYGIIQGDLVDADSGHLWEHPLLGHRYRDGLAGPSANGTAASVVDVDASTVQDVATSASIAALSSYAGVLLLWAGADNHADLSVRGDRVVLSTTVAGSRTAAKTFAVADGFTAGEANLRRRVRCVAKRDPTNTHLAFDCFVDERWCMGHVITDAGVYAALSGSKVGIRSESTVQRHANFFAQGY